MDNFSDVIVTSVVAIIIIELAVRGFYKEYKAISQGKCQCAGSCGSNNIAGGNCGAGYRDDGCGCGCSGSK